jgi:hypothetical protein
MALKVVAVFSLIPMSLENRKEALSKLQPGAQSTHAGLESARKFFATFSLHYGQEPASPNRGDANFQAAKFLGKVDFSEAEFSGDVEFKEAEFFDNIWFHTTTFSKAQRLGPLDGRGPTRPGSCGL